jgi:methionyl-tRNA formyltransferase
MSSLRTAYFGRPADAISVGGFRIALGCDGIEIVSVTCGRAAAALHAEGPLLCLAHEAGIPVLLFEDVDRRFPDLDLALSLSNPVVFPASFVERVRYGILNLHPAPLPEYRGCHGIEHALMAGARTFGPTLHYCDARIDHGPVVDRALFALAPEDDAASIWEKVDARALGLLRDYLPRVVVAAREGRRLPAVPQDDEQGRYYDHHSFPPGSEVPPGALFEQVLRFVRACQHPRREPAFLPWDGRRVVLRYEAGRLVVADIEEGPAAP